jgi:hypothetical protein
MARAKASHPFAVLINSFVGGELSRHMDGRTDHAKYYHGCRRLENFIARPQGSVYRRPGTVQVAEVFDSDYAFKLIPFNYDDSNDNSYMLISGKNRIYVGYKGALLQNAGTDYYFTGFNDEEDVHKLRYHQLGDILYIVHPDIAPGKITRLAHYPPSWTCTPIAFKDGPYLSREEGDETVVFTPSAYTGSGITLTASTNFFTAEWVGRHIRLGYEDPSDPETIQWGWGKIVSRISATQVVFDVIGEFGQQHVDDPNFDVGLSGWSDKSTGTASITYDAANKRMQFQNDASTGVATGRLELTVVPGIPLTLTVNIDSVSDTVRVYAGSTDGGTNYLSVKTISATGVYTYSVTPTTSKCWVSLDMASAAASATATVTTVSLFKSDLSTSEWRIGAIYKDNGVKHYPSALCFHEQRLLMAVHRQIYGSKTDRRYETFGFSTPILADDSFSFDLVAPKVSSIKWMMSSEDLLIGTNSSEQRVLPGIEGDYLSAESPIKTKTQSNFGSSDLSILEGGASALFVSPTGKVVRDLPFEYSAQKFKAVDITQLAEHVFASKVVSWCWASEPDPIIWCVLADGTLAACTYMPDQDVFAWHRHRIAGTEASVEDIASIPGDGYSQVWMIVRRKINGVFKRFIEYFDTKFYTNPFIDDARYSRVLDCSKSADAWNTDSSKFMTLTATSYDAGSSGVMTATGHTPFVVGDVGKTFFIRKHTANKETRVKVTGYTSTSEVDVEFLWDVPTVLQDQPTEYWAEASIIIAGLEYLEGESVSIMADGNYLGEDTVVDGKLTLANPAVVTTVGYKYQSLLQPMRLEVPTYGSTLQARDKRIVKATVRVIDTVGGEVCPYDDREDRYEPFNPLLAPIIGGEAPKLFNGDNTITPAGADDEAGIITIRQADPFPMTVVCVIPELDT